MDLHIGLNLSAQKGQNSNWSIIHFWEAQLIFYKHCTQTMHEKDCLKVQQPGIFYNLKIAARSNPTCGTELQGFCDLLQSCSPVCRLQISALSSDSPGVLKKNVCRDDQKAHEKNLRSLRTSKISLKKKKTRQVDCQCCTNFLFLPGAKGRSLWHWYPSSPPLKLAASSLALFPWLTASGILSCVSVLCQEQNTHCPRSPWSPFATLQENSTCCLNQSPSTQEKNTPQ